MIPTLGFQREKREAPVRSQHLSQSRLHLELRSVASNLGGSGPLRPRDKVRMDLLTFLHFQHFLKIVIILSYALFLRLEVDTIVTFSTYLPEKHTIIYR